MSAPTPLVVEAQVDPAERAAMIAAAEQLSEHLTLARDGQAWPIRLHFKQPGAPVAEDPVPHIVITSMLPETARLDDPMAAVEARWRADLERLVASGAVVFVCTVFRHVAGRVRDGATSSLLERIRRLNRMTLDLSHDLGVGVIDFDRDLSHVGARGLSSDYRLGGVLAAEVAGHTVAWALLSFGLDAVIEPEAQEKARALLGDLQDIDRLVNHRLALRRARRAEADAGG